MVLESLNCHWQIVFFSDMGKIANLTRRGDRFDDKFLSFFMPFEICIRRLIF